MAARDDPAMPAASARHNVSLSSRAALAAVSELAAQSFATVDEAIDATLNLMQRVLGMEVRMVNEVTGDQLTFRRLQTPPGFPDLEGMVTPLNHNF